jgi:hypothetical protein
MIAIQGYFVERKASKSNQMDAALARIVTHSKLSRFVSNCIGGHIHPRESVYTCMTGLLLASFRCLLTAVLPRAIDHVQEPKA